MFNLEYFAADGAAAAAGVFIPVGDLPGVDAAELDAADTARSSKSILGIYRALFNHIASLTVQPLGFLLSATGLDSLNETYSTTFSFMGNHSDGSLTKIPLGSASGLTIDAVFPNASKVSAAGSTGGAGVLIPTSELLPYGSPDQADIALDADSRDWFGAAFFYLVDKSDLRSDTVASAIVSKSVGTISALFPPAEWTTGASALTAVGPEELTLRSFFTRTYSVTVQLVKNHDDQTFDVNHVTA